MKKYLLFIIFSFFLAGSAHAASLYIKPASTETSSGNIFNVQIVVDTSGKFINNSEGILLFPADLLEVVSLDSRSSIFSLWVEEPAFSNNVGRVSFNGGVPNPGFQGTSGKILSVTFRAKKVGVTSLVLSDAAVRENDGLGTDILVNKVGATININAPVLTPKQEPVINTVSTRMSAPLVSSISHPKQDSWYNSSEVILSWILPTGATAVKTFIDSNPDSDTVVYYDKIITTKTIKNVSEGASYFHINYLKAGEWSNIAHYKLQIDNHPPENLSAEAVKDSNGKIAINIKAEDKLSGMGHYNIFPDNDEPIIVKSNSNEETVAIPYLSPGEHIITITAFDKAENNISTKINVTSDYITKLNIDSYPAKINTGENIEVSGTAPYPYSDLSVSLMDGKNIIENYKIQSDSYAKFKFVSQSVKEAGNYSLWIDVINKNGEVSHTSQRVNIKVVSPLLLTIGSHTTKLLSALIPTIILLIILILVLYYGWYKFLSLHHRIKKHLTDIEHKIHDAYSTLYLEASKQMSILEKAKNVRELSEDEKKAMAELKSSLKHMDEYIEKQIQKIDEDVL